MKSPGRATPAHPGLKPGRADDDAHVMIEVSAWSGPVSVTARELTYQETADLDRLRAVLASACDRTDPRAISWLWDSMVTTHGGPAPAGFVEAVATALGDLLAVHVSGARWAVWPGPSGPTLGVASLARPHAPVVPFLDTQDRWDARARDWMADYLSRAAAHLSGLAVPQPRQAPDDAATRAGEEHLAATVAAATADRTVYEPVAATPGWSPLVLPTRGAAPAEVPQPALPTPALPLSTVPASAVPTPAVPTPAVPAPTVPAPAVPAPSPVADRELPLVGLERPVARRELPVAEPERLATEPESRVTEPERRVTEPERLVAGPAVPTATPWAPLPAPSAPGAAAPVPVTANDEPTARVAPATPVDEFALDALDHAMVLLRETGAFDREVFVLLIDADGRRRTESCPGEVGEARFRARELVRSSGAVRAATTFIDRDPADLPGPRQTFPAVVVDAWDAGAEGVRVGRRFVDDVLGTGPLGPPLVVGHIARLL